MLGACRPAPWRGYAVGWHILGSDKGNLPWWCPWWGWYWNDCGRNREYLSSELAAKLVFQIGYPAVFFFKPFCNLCGAFAIEGHGNKGFSLIGGKVAALAVMIDAIPGLLVVGLSPLWLACVVIGSFLFLHTSQMKLTRIILSTVHIPK